MSLNKDKLNQVQNDIELANLVTSTFLEKAENQSDLNQVSFNSIIKQTLETACFTKCFEKLLVRSEFKMNIIHNVFSPNSIDVVFETYTFDADGVGHYTNEGLVDKIMGIALFRSRLIERLINQAYDFKQEAKYPMNNLFYC
jgi:hypothetical protein